MNAGSQNLLTQTDLLPRHASLLKASSNNPSVFGSPALPLPFAGAAVVAATAHR
jgi:hypothetical protein